MSWLGGAPGRTLCAMSRRITDDKALQEILDYLRSHGETDPRELAVALDLPLGQVRELLVEIDQDELGDLTEEFD